MSERSFSFSELENNLHQAETSVKKSIQHLSLSRLYSEDGTARVPSSYKEMTPDGDVITVGTRFGQQAALGMFGLDSMGDSLQREKSVFDQLTEQYSNEITDFVGSLKECMALRSKYMALSCQRNIDNPIFHMNWRSYPPNQAKFWHYEDEFGSSGYYYDERAETHYSGEKFDLDDYVRKFVEPLQATCARYRGLKIGKCYGIQVKGFAHPELPNFHEYLQDLKKVIDTSISKAGVMLSMRRLKYLKSKFEEYSLLNNHQELLKTKLNPHRDFYNVRKIDNNITLSMSMSKKHLLNVINHKLESEPERIVYREGDVELTLEQLFSPYLTSNSNRLNIDDLFEFGLIDRTFGYNDFTTYESSDVDSKKRFEAMSRVEKTFLEYDNSINGEYLSIIIKQVMSDYEKSKYQLGELGVQLNLQRKLQSWRYLSKWIIDHKLVSHNVKWVIRISRNYSILRSENKVKSFQDYLNIIFKPLFEVSMNPAIDYNLFFLMTKISGFDLLSRNPHNRDESLFDVLKLSPPTKWTSLENPPYCYYMYYLFVNISNLNSFRKSKGLSTFNLRPHVASVSDKSGLGIITESLSTCFLLSKNIINGEKLANYPVLEYLYYLKQIGITMSPLCWNKTLNLLADDDYHIESNTTNSYEKNPAIEFFKIGIRIGLSTNKPLFSSLTREPLIEEYSICGSIHKLSNVDLCEISRNSILISEFNGHVKRHWIGIEYVENDDDSKYDYNEIDEFAIQRTNVPDMRLDYRSDCLKFEHEFLNKIISKSKHLKA